jgi:hypothetical protein
VSSATGIPRREYEANRPTPHGFSPRTASPANQNAIAAEAPTMIHCSAAPAARAIPPNASVSSRNRTPSARRCEGAATALIVRRSVRQPVLELTGHVRSSRPGRPAIHWLRTEGRSSVGRAAVSKTVGRGFESLRPCSSKAA